MHNLIPIKVECHAGYKSDEYPRCFYHGNCIYYIKEITDRWYQGNNNPEWSASDYFKVVTTCKKQFILKHDLENDLWYMYSDRI